MATFNSLTSAQQKQIQHLPRAEAQAAMAKMTAPTTKPTSTAPSSGFQQSAPSTAGQSPYIAPSSVTHGSNKGVGLGTGVATPLQNAGIASTASPSAAGFTGTNTFGGEYRPTPGAPAPPPPNTPVAEKRYLTADELAKLTGLTIDPQTLEKIYQEANERAFGNLDKEYGAISNKFYDRLYDTSATQMDMLRKNNSSAVATGASRGMQAVSQLSAMNALGQEATADSTQMAQDRAGLADKRAAADAESTKDAHEKAESNRRFLGTLAAQIQANEVQFGAAELGYLEGKFSSEAQKEVGLDGNAKNLEGNQFIANRNYDGLDRQSTSFENQQTDKLAHEVSENALERASREKVAVANNAATVEAARQSAAARGLTGAEAETYQDSMVRIWGAQAVWTKEARQEAIAHGGGDPAIGEMYDKYFVKPTPGSIVASTDEGKAQIEAEKRKKVDSALSGEPQNDFQKAINWTMDKIFETFTRKRTPEEQAAINKRTADELAKPK